MLVLGASRLSGSKSMRKGSLQRFGIVGLVNTATGLLLIWIARELAGFSDTASNGFGYAVAIVMSFILNKRWTFAFRGSSFTALWRFLTVIATAYAANLFTVLSLASLTTLHPMACQVAGVVPYSSLVYLGCRWYAFPTQERPQAARD
jgi:putative flippase GtrA